MSDTITTRLLSECTTPTMLSMMEETFRVHSYRERYLSFVPATVWDLGACIGCYSGFAALTWPDAQILAVEPNPENVVRIRRVFAGYPNVTVCEAAIGRKPIYRRLHEHSCCHVYNSSPNVNAVPSPDTVVFSLAELAAAYPPSAPFYIKMDIECAEQWVLYDDDSLPVIQMADAVAIEIHGWQPQYNAWLDKLRKTHVVVKELHPNACGFVWLIKKRACHSIALETRMNIVASEFLRAKSTPGDIHEHMDRLFDLATECQHIVEGGVRYVVSTWAWILGCACRGGEVHSYCWTMIQEIERAIAICAVNKVPWYFHEGDWLQVDIPETDLLFIDTNHTFSQLTQELAKHGNKARKYIVLHDTTLFGEIGADGCAPGLWQAVVDFMNANPHWKVIERKTNCSGLTTLIRT